MDLGRLYLRAHYYDPATGRFLSRDPFPGLQALPASQHPYAYAYNNPTNWTDPSGELAPLVLGGIVIGGDYLLGGAALATLVSLVSLQQHQAEIRALGDAIGYSCEAAWNQLSAKLGPNPDGSRGSTRHRDKIQERIDELQGEGLEPLYGGKGRKEETVPIPPGGHRGARRPDITMRDPETGKFYRENVGRTTKSGQPVAREQKALDDLERATGVRPGYTPYDR